jgi:hypothetical protein
MDYEYWLDQWKLPEKIKKPVAVQYELRNGSKTLIFIGIKSMISGFYYPLIEKNRVDPTLTQIPANAVRKQGKLKKTLFDPTKIRVTRIEHAPYDDWAITHDNGSRPFAVLIRGNSVFVYKIPSNAIVWNDDWDQKDPEKNLPMFSQEILKITNVSRVFIGEDLTGERLFHGNSVLVEETLKKYVLIGKCIMRFSTQYPVTEFVSDVGNSNIPYPYCKDNGNVYLLAEHVYVPLNLIRGERSLEVYSDFYVLELNKHPDIEGLCDMEILHSRIT